MTLRILIAGLICALLSAIAWQLDQPASPAAGIARQLSGERWYSLALDDRQLGYWHTRTTRNDAGNWVFESEQRFAMDNNEPVSTRTIRTFSGEPPHHLLLAEHTRRGRNDLTGVRVEQTATGYQSDRLPAGSTPLAVRNWQYDMADYLGFELWLDANQPEPGSTRTVTTLDFERTALINRTFDVVDRQTTGYVVENAAPLSATRIELDNQYVPTQVEISGLFTLQLTSRRLALAPRSTLHSASYYIPADQRLRDHTRISRLILNVEGKDADLFESITRKDDGWQLTLKANPISSRRVNADHLSETLNIPSRHPEISALAEQALLDLKEGDLEDGDLNDDMQRAQALSRFVNGYLTYRPGEPPRGVLSLLEQPVGDCTEFADLLTTLARSIGLPAQTVFGLAYADGESPAFAYHAWNELFVDGRWVAMDPTWGLDRVDATHIPLPANETAALKLLTGSVDLAFRVEAVEHFPD